MTEQQNHVYEWTYDEEQLAFLCVGQVFMLGVQYDDDNECWWSIAWDAEPVDPRWDHDKIEAILQQPHKDVHSAMDWCEARDINEAEFDASMFNL